MTEKYDLIVIGAGPGGYVAAIRAAQLQLKVAIIEKEHLGGICLNWGCIPTKALLRTAEIYQLMHNLDEFGLSAKDFKFDLAKIVARSRKVSAQLATGVKGLLKKNKVTVIDGKAKILSKNTILVEHGSDKKNLEAKNIIIATGTRAKELPGMEVDGKLIWGYREAMTPDMMPKSLLVIGSGAIGVEFASFYNSLGAKVTIAEVADRILIAADEDVSDFAKRSFEKQGINILTNTKISNIKKNKKDVTVTIAGKEQTFDRIIVAIGVDANSKDIGLETTKIKLDRGFIVTNKYLETDEAGIYAIGDVAGAPCLAHKASHEAILAVEKIAGHNVHAMKKENIPSCIYSHPQIASVGLTEKEAKALGYKLKIGKFPFMANGKAIALGDADGFVKTIFDEKTGELLGAHMIGAEVTELIQGYVVAKSIEATELDLMHVIFPHPTLSEMMHESVLDAYDKAIHI
jgi:dihydrolipoamide dehydrogenase